MNTIKKFETFEQLKSCEHKTLKVSSRLSIHNEFKKFIMDIRHDKKHQISPNKQKK